MAILKCKICGGDMEISADKTFGTCEYCGSTMTLPKIDDDVRAAAFNRGNHFRRTGEFDKALSVYERIVEEDPNDAEAHWCCALCRFGIEWVEDPGTMEYLPTCHRVSFDPFTEDVDCKAAIELSDGITKRQYQKEAARISEVQKGILAASQNEKPFDVFICYKESDESGKRTVDSTLAQEIYYQLTEEGLRVFFARITLEDKAGSEYEPYIFAALNSAKVMVVVGTKPEHFNAVWVKNEWARFLSIVKRDRKKVILPCYRDMDPYDLPEQLSILQSYDMSKIGFMQDLIRGIKKITKADEPKTIVKETVVAGGSSGVAPLLKRAFIFLEDGSWQEADEYCEKVLDQDPENGEAYLGKLMAELNVRKRESLADVKQPFDNSSNYQKAVRFGDEKLRSELTGYITHINERNENERCTGIYDRAVNVMNASKTEGAFRSAAATFQTISGFKDADALAEQCLEKAEVCRKDTIYASAKTQMAKNSAFGYDSAIKSFQTIPGWKDADDQIITCRKRIEEINAREEAYRLEYVRRDKEMRIAKEKAAKKRNMILLIVASIALVCGIITILMMTVVIPNIRYNSAVKLYNAGQYEEAISAFEELDGFKDSDEQIKNCIYTSASEKYSAGNYDEAITLFKSLYGYKDSKTQIKECIYASAAEKYRTGDYDEAITLFSSLNDYKDSAEQAEKSEKAAIDKKYNYALELYNTGNYKDAIVSFRSLYGYYDCDVKYDECCLKMTEISFESKNYNEALSYYKMTSGYDENSDYYRKICYYYALNLLDDKKYVDSVEMFQNSKGYEDADAQIKTVKYQYVIENKNPNNLTTYDYLTELKDDNYSDAKSIYDDLYEWKAELVCFNTDKNDYTTILNSIKKNESYLHFSFEITGGMPGTKTTFTHSIKLPGSNTDKSSWDWEGRELGDNLSAQWSSGFSSNRGEAIIKIIHKDSGKVIGEFSFKITT